jgi:hypothetical protein
MRSYIPYGVSPAVLLPFDNDFAIDEAAFRKHLRDVAATDGISADYANDPPRRRARRWTRFRSRMQSLLHSL